MNSTITARIIIQSNRLIREGAFTVASSLNSIFISQSVQVFISLKDMTAEIAKSTDQVEVKVENSLAELKTEETLPVSKMPSQDSSQEEQWQQFGKTASAFIDNLQRDTADFFNQYQQIFATLGWFLLAVITVKLILAAVDALNDIPFLELILELIGLAYVAWFVFRYLLSAAARQELFNEINSFKEQVLGKAN